MSAADTAANDLARDPALRRVVVCLDKFRGSASATQACRAVADGVRATRPTLEVVELPLADGGEGTVDALVQAGYARHEATVTSAGADPIPSAFATRKGHAVVELAQASGFLPGVSKVHPLRATTYGTGELIVQALGLGCRAVTLALGGSATTDGGAGMLQALGARLVAADGTEVGPGGAGLLDLVRVDLSRLDTRVARVDWQVATDVNNPLLGPLGAASVFAPQKGASPEEVLLLERALQHFACLMVEAVGFDPRGSAGAGAAGGAAFAAMAALRAVRVSGVDFILDQLAAREAITGSTLVVVGEGCMDEQSLAGKAPVGASRLAQALGVRVAVVAGKVLLPNETLAALGISHAFSVLDRASNLAESLNDPLPHLRAIGAELAWLV